MNDLLLIVALITMVQGGKDLGTATGFFYQQNETAYFVTNRHVVIDESQGLKPDALRLRLHADSRDLTKNVDRTIPLYNGGTPRWHVHKDYPKVPIDIAVIEMEPKLLEGTIIKALSSKAFFTGDNNLILTPGEDLMVISYPRGQSDQKHNLALMRNALVSSAYGIDFNGLPKFLVDANLHPGMSGSPVMTKPKTILPTSTGYAVSPGPPRTFFLGVLSATLIVNVSAKQQEALGLGEVWYANLIEQIIDSAKR